MYEPLHHKYRPQTFAQLVGQRAISDTLTHALQQARIAPAYLFCGPRGTGKTSSARILAKSLNCLQVSAPTAQPCGECDLCRSVSRGNALDIVEIDAASNTGVDNIRELIERSQFAPVQCRYKVYVIDECHMLSTAAFNALLKTLEEPPDRVVFVLATTDPQRVLPTIISRCQRFDFRRIPLPAMIKHLSYIAAAESIQIAESAVQLVAQISQGGLRDAESLLDQLSLQANEITVESVWDLVGAVPERDLLNLVRALAADDSTALLERVRQLMDKGREPLIVLQSLVGFYRDLLIAKSAPTRDDLVAITPPTWAEMTAFAKKLSAVQLLASQQKLQSAEGQVKNTTQPRLWLEITLIQLLPSALGATATLSAGSAQIQHSAARSVLAEVKPPSISPPAEPVTVQPIIKPVESKPVESKPVESKPVESKPVESKPVESKPVESAPTPSEPPEIAFGRLSDLWAKILAALQPRGTQMLMSQQGELLAFDGVSTTVGFRSPSLQKMAQERVPNLEAAFLAVFHRPIRVSLKVAEAKKNVVDQADDNGQNDGQNDGQNNQQNEQNNRLSPQNQPPANPSAPLPPDQYSPPAPLPSSLNSSPAAHNTLPSDGLLDSRAARQNHHQADSPANGQANEQTNNNGRANYAQSSESLPAAESSPVESSAKSPADRWAVNQDLDNIKRFAEFFNGQIVSLDDESASPSPSGNQSPDPGPDVPF